MLREPLTRSARQYIPDMGRGLSEVVAKTTSYPNLFFFPELLKIATTAVVGVGIGTIGGYGYEFSAQHNLTLLDFIGLQTTGASLALTWHFAAEGRRVRLSHS